MSTRQAAIAAGQLPTQVNLSVYQGDDFLLKIVVDDTLSPIDLTTYTAKAEIRAIAGGPTVLATFDVTIVDAVTLMLHLTHDDSALLAGNGVWDVELTDATGMVTTLAAGAVILVKDVTR
jgi:hypothetical protein